MMDFSTLKYDITQIPKGKKVIEYFVELAEFKEFKDKSKDLLLRIAILATDEGSPFIKAERDSYEKRITAIIEYLEVKDKKLIERIVDGIDRDYNSIVNRYFIICDNLTYVMWQNKLMNFHYIGIALRKAPDMNNLVTEMSKRATLEKQQKEIYDDLIEYESQIFPDAPTRRILRKQVAKILQMPEQFADDKQVI